MLDARPGRVEVRRPPYLERRVVVVVGAGATGKVDSILSLVVSRRDGRMTANEHASIGKENGVVVVRALASGVADIVPRAAGVLARAFNRRHEQLVGADRRFVSG